MALFKLLRSLTPHKRPKVTTLAEGRLAMNLAVDSPGLFAKDTSGGLVKFGPVHIGPTPPNATPATNGETGNCKGEDWLDTSVTPPVRRTWNGTTWLASQGERGLTGLTGPAGPTGPTGPTGPAGPTAVSTNAGNLSKLGTDGLLMTSPTDVAQYFVAKTSDTGAAISPSGTSAQRPSSPVIGHERWNTESGCKEVYAGTAGWLRLAFARLRTDQQDLVYTQNTTLSGGVYACRNLTINAGVTLTVGSQTLVFLCTGNATINGSIVADGAGPLGGSEVGAYGFVPSNPGTGIGAGVGITAGVPYVPFVSLVGSAGASGFANMASSSYVVTSRGGRAGGSIGISAEGQITLGSSCTLSAKGGNAVAASGAIGNVDASGGGGGSGGSIILNGQSGLSVAGTLNVSGGNGANAVGAFSGKSTGGGGGGGGIVVLQTLGTLTNTASIVLNPGTRGTTVGVGAGLGSGAGGSFGGRGGDGSNTLNAQSGVVLNYGSPF